MSFASERQAIESRFSTQWGTTTPIKYDNIKYVPTAGTSFVALEIHKGASIQASLGTSPLFRGIGIISVNIYTPTGSGTNTGRAYADTAAGIFRNVVFSGIVCKSASVTRLGEQEGWFIYNVSIPFYHDETY